MEANELMVGDWYYDTDLKKKRQWHQLQFSEAFGDPTYHMAINPIPLTEEMLKANDWESSGTADCHFCWHKDTPFDVVTRGFLLQSEKIFGDDYFESVLLRLDYVHELQHALRLCGLRELADNFKIE